MSAVGRPGVAVLVTLILSSLKISTARALPEVRPENRNRRLEHALALELPGGGQQGIVFRMDGGEGVGVFLPVRDGKFELLLFPGLGPGVESIALTDSNGDGIADLLASRSDGTITLAMGDGRGGFVPREDVNPSPSEADPHSAHHPTSAAMSTRLSAAERKSSEALLQDSGRSNWVFSAPPMGAVSVIQIDRNGDGRREQAALMSDGRIVAQRPDGWARLGTPALPQGFEPRLLVAGRFGSPEESGFAVIGAGARPRLILSRSAAVEGAGNRSTPLAMDSFTEVASPLVVQTVFVGQGGFSFDPQTVNIATGDTVHWVWSSGGHTVTSGSSCTANNLFCSPNNTNCSTASTSSMGATYDRVFPTAGSFPYFCRPHCTFMTGQVNVAANIVEAGNLRVLPTVDPMMTSITYTPACGATSHAIFIGKSSVYTPLTGLNWTSSACTGVSGAAVISTGAPPALTYLVIVGQDATHEGSYGKSSLGIERPEAVGIGSCDRPRATATSCP